VNRQEDWHLYSEQTEGLAFIQWTDWRTGIYTMNRLEDWHLYSEKTGGLAFIQ